MRRQDKHKAATARTATARTAKVRTATASRQTKKISQTAVVVGLAVPKVTATLIVMATATIAYIFKTAAEKRWTL